MESQQLEYIESANIFLAIVINSVMTPTHRTCTPCSLLAFRTGQLELRRQVKVSSASRGGSVLIENRGPFFLDTAHLDAKATLLL